MNYLFACAIGPVQDFIATARRSRDLWFGSWMLSELSKAAVLNLANEVKANLIFPAPLSTEDLQPGSEFIVPNRILAIIARDPHETGEQVRGAVYDRLRSMADDAFKMIPQNDTCFDRKLAEDQLTDLIEFYWSAVPYPDESAYPAARENVESLLSNRKNTRDFVQMTGSMSPKSSLDGSRESVISEERYPARNAGPEEREQKSRDLYSRYRAKIGERLSGVDLLKRLGQATATKTPQFHSTSHYAAKPFLEMLDKEDQEKGTSSSQLLLDAIEKEYQRVNWVVSDVPNDGALLFESRLSDTVPPGPEQDLLRRKINTILQERVGDARPSPYYVILRADGDSMGRFIDAQRDAETHRKISQTLSEFAERAAEIIKKHDGGAIYTGGDDILAFLPLHRALDCANALEEQFRIAMSQLKTNNEILGDPPTLSAGIVIAHHLDPLADILELSKKAERKAKNINGKNGLAITLSKRSGIDRTIAGKWSEINKSMHLLIADCQNKAISRGVAYEFHKLNLTMGGIKELEEALPEEAIRILDRKKESSGQSGVDKGVLERYRGWINDVDCDLEELAFRMIVANTFAGAYEQVGK